MSRLIPHLERPCACCGQEFRPPPAELRRGQGKYCCRDCWRKDKAAIRAVRQCTTCGADFTVKVDRDKYGTNKYCSRRCYHQGKTNGRSLATPEEQAKNTARGLARYAVQTGRLTRPPFCEACGDEADTHAHHPDYSKPFEVMFLCVSCHRTEHVRTAKGGDAACSPRCSIA